MCAEHNHRVLDEGHGEYIVPLLEVELEWPVHTDAVGVLAQGMTVKDSVSHVKLTEWVYVVLIT